MDLEDGQKFGYLQQLANPGCQVREFHFAAGATSRGEQAHQRSKSAAIDICDIGKIEHDAIVMRKQALYQFANRSRFLPKDDTATAINDCDSFHIASAELQLHGMPLPRRKYGREERSAAGLVAQVVLRGWPEGSANRARGNNV